MFCYKFIDLCGVLVRLPLAYALHLLFLSALCPFRLAAAKPVSGLSLLPRMCSVPSSPVSMSMQLIVGRLTISISAFQVGVAFAVLFMFMFLLFGVFFLLSVHRKLFWQ